MLSTDIQDDTQYQYTTEEAIVEIKKSLGTILEGIAGLKTYVRSTNTGIEAVFVADNPSIRDRLIKFFQFCQFDIQAKIFSKADKKSKDTRWQNKYVACLSNPRIGRLKVASATMLEWESAINHEGNPDYNQEVFQTDLPELKTFIAAPKAVKLIEEVISITLALFVSCYNSEHGEENKLRTMSADVLMHLRIGISNGIYKALHEYLVAGNANLHGKLLVIHSDCPPLASALYGAVRQFIGPPVMEEPDFIILELPHGFCVRDCILKGIGSIQRKAVVVNVDPVLKLLNKLSACKLTTARWNCVENQGGQKQYILKSDNSELLLSVQKIFESKGVVATYDAEQKELKLINPNVEILKTLKPIKYEDPKKHLYDDAKIVHERFLAIGLDCINRAFSKLPANRFRDQIIDAEECYTIGSCINNVLIPELISCSNAHLGQIIIRTNAVGFLADFPEDLYRKIFEGVLEYLFAVPEAKEISLKIKLLSNNVDSIAKTLFNGFTRNDSIKLKPGKGHFVDIPENFPVAEVLKQILGNLRTLYTQRTSTPKG